MRLDDSRRVAALRWYRRALSSSDLDRYSRLVSTALNVPTALFSVVDVNEQRFAAAEGLIGDVAETRCTPISESYCRHVVEDERPLVIDDTADHPDFKGHPGTERLGIGAYAGVPVRDVDGTVLGALCAIDHHPRCWSSGDLGVLSDLAVSLEKELALHRSRGQVERKLRIEQQERLLAEKLSTIASAANRASGIGATAGALVQHGSDVIGASLISLAVVEGKTVRFFHGPGVHDPVAQAWVSAPVDTQVPMVRSAVDQETIVVADRAGFDRWPAMAAAVDELGLASFVAVPIRDPDIELRACVGMGFAHPLPGGKPPDGTDGLIRLTAQALSRATRFDHTLDHARTLERIAVPRVLPPADGLEFAAVYLAPNRSQRVGGDIYDSVTGPDGVVGLVVADAAGHDLDATRAATRVRHAVGALLMEGLGPAQVLRSVNRYLLDSPETRLVTCVCVQIDRNRSTGSIASAGHPLPRLISPTGAGSIGRLGDPLLGLTPHEFRQYPFDFGADDAIMMFTDGLIESRSHGSGSGEIALDDQLSGGLSRLTDMASPAAADVVNSLIDGLRAQDREDDVAVVAVIRRSPAGQDGEEAEAGGRGSGEPQSYCEATHGLTMSWPRASTSLASARRRLRDWLANNNAEDFEESASLILTELLTNAREAAADGTHLEVTVNLVDGGLQLLVSNRGDSFDLIEDMPEPSSVRGRGLPIVNQLAHSVSVDHTRGLLTIRAQLRRPGTG